jgi:hypothetical protein
MQTSFGILKVTTCIAMTDHDDGIRKSLKFVWPEIQSSYACFIFYRLSGGIFLLLLAVLLRKTNRMYFQSSSCVFTLTKIISRKQKKHLGLIYHLFLLSAHSISLILEMLQWMDSSYEIQPSNMWIQHQQLLWNISLTDERVCHA